MMSLKIRFVFLIILTVNVNSKAQSCVTDFIQDITNYYSDKKNKYEKNTERNIKRYRQKGYNLDSVHIILIPIIFSSREGAKLSGECRLKKENLFCYIDSKSLDYDEALIFLDNEILGSIIKFPGSGYILLNDSLRIEFIKPLIAEIRSIDPDIIFQIYNLPRCYWYIKNNDLFVLSFEQENSEMNNFNNFTAAEYIKEHLQEYEVHFLSNKRIVVIGN